MMGDVNWTAAATGVGVICGAIGTLIGGLLTLWWTKGTESRVKIIRAESDAKFRSQTETISRKEEENIRLRDVNAAHEKRITKLEDDYEKLRQQGHDERNTWYQDSLKCAKETAELKGQLTVLQQQFNQLQAALYPKQSLVPQPVTVTNPGPIPSVG